MSNCRCNGHGTAAPAAVGGGTPQTPSPTAASAAAAAAAGCVNTPERHPLTLGCCGELRDDCVANRICVREGVPLLCRQVLQLLDQLLGCLAVLGSPLLPDALDACRSSGSSSSGRRTCVQTLVFSEGSTCTLFSRLHTQCVTPTSCAQTQLFLCAHRHHPELLLLVPVPLRRLVMALRCRRQAALAHTP